MQLRLLLIDRFGNTPIALELTGIALGLIALVLAYKHLRGLSRALTRLDDINKGLKDSLVEIGNELSTRPLYEFPRYVLMIATLIRTARRNVVVFCDTPAYGSFSDPPAFHEYRDAITKRVQTEIEPSVRVEIYCMNEKERRKGAMRQFPEDAFGQYMERNGPKFKFYLNAHRRHDQHLTVDNLSYREFIDMIAEEDTHTLDAFGGLASDKLDGPPPIYFWYFDEAEMVFVIPDSARKRSQENGFFTRDPHLINGILDVTEKAFSHLPVHFKRAGHHQDLATSGYQNGSATDE